MENFDELLRDLVRVQNGLTTGCCGGFC